MGMLDKTLNFHLETIINVFMSNEQGVQIVNTVSTLGSDRTIPIPIVNETNKTMKLFRHRVVVWNEKTGDHDVADINSVLSGP